MLYLNLWPIFLFLLFSGLFCQHKRFRFSRLFSFFSLFFFSLRISTFSVTFFLSNSVYFLFLGTSVLVLKSFPYFFFRAACLVYVFSFLNLSIHFSTWSGSGNGQRDEASQVSNTLCLISPVQLTIFIAFPFYASIIQCSFRCLHFGMSQDNNHYKSEILKKNPYYCSRGYVDDSPK